MPDLNESTAKIQSTRQRGILYRVILLDEKMLALIFAGVLLLLGGGALGGYYFAERDRGVTGELRSCRERLDRHYDGTQSQMTIISQYQLQLASMEKYFIEFQIWNQPGYEKREAAFMSDCTAWDKKYEIEAEKPSEFEGGSMAPMDCNMRMTSMVEKRIDELKTTWMK
ncbi:MAG: hypothetical protein PHX61_12365 [Alphaproteobacteria bacterium]|nr:hypothetical protein [Alphaproteobacteria bacterium]